MNDPLFIELDQSLKVELTHMAEIFEKRLKAHSNGTPKIRYFKTFNMFDDG